jgi:hypothetical protein
MMLFAAASTPGRSRRRPCAGTHAMAMRRPLSFDDVRGFLDTLLATRPARQTGEAFARGHARGDPVRVAGGWLDRPGSAAGARAADQARGQAGGPAAVQPPQSMPSWSIGYLTWSANATASRWRWTGPSSTPTARRRSCCLCCPATDGPRRWFG